MGLALCKELGLGFAAISYLGSYYTAISYIIVFNCSYQLHKFLLQLSATYVPIVAFSYLGSYCSYQLYGFLL